MGMNNLMKAALGGFLALAIAGGLAAAKEWELARSEKITVDGVSAEEVIRRGENSEGLVEWCAEVKPSEALNPQVEQKAGPSAASCRTNASLVYHRPSASRNHAR